MRVLVIAEHDNQSLKASTLTALGAASHICDTIDLVIAGYDCAAVSSEAATIECLDKVYVADNICFEYQLAEAVAPLVANMADGYSHILTSATTTGKNLLPRIAALLDVQPISDVTAIDSDDTFVHPIYAGNIVARVQSSDAIKLLTVRQSAFDAVACSAGAPVNDVVVLDGVIVQDKSVFVKQTIAVSERPELTEASIVISGGRGLQNGDNFQLLYDLADKLGAAVGASRAAVDAGFVPNDMQVGQTGKIVAPDVYVAVGISGAIQHLAGMKESKVIVAINLDEDAPIFQVADYGLVADLFDAVPELIAAFN